MITANALMMSASQLGIDGERRRDQHAGKSGHAGAKRECREPNSIDRNAGNACKLGACRCRPDAASKRVNCNSHRRPD